MEGTRRVNVSLCTCRPRASHCYSCRLGLHEPSGYCAVRGAGGKRLTGDGPGGPNEADAGRSYGARGAPRGAQARGIGLRVEEPGRHGVKVQGEAGVVRRGQARGQTIGRGQARPEPWSDCSGRLILLTSPQRADAPRPWHKESAKSTNKKGQAVPEEGGDLAK